MSLIGDALRIADRERVAQPKRPTKPLAQVVIPSPRPRRKSMARVASIAAVGLVTGLSVVVGAAWSLRVRSGGSITHRRPAIPPAPALGSTALPALPPTTAPQATSPAAKAPTPSASSAPAQAIPSAAVKTEQPKADSTPTRATPVAASTPTSALVLQQGTARPVAPPKVAVQSPTSIPAAPPAVAQPTPPATPSRATTPAGPRVADSLFKLAYAAHLRGSLDTAAALYQQTIATNSAPATAFNDYGVLLKLRGDSSGAARMFREAITHDATNVDAWVNLGDVLAASGERADAVSAFAHAAQLDPSRVIVKTRLAALYEAIGEISSARQFLEEAVKLEPANAASHYAFGIFLQNQRELAPAIREYERFLELAGDRYPPSTIAEVQKHVAELKKLAP